MDINDEILIDLLFISLQGLLLLFNYNKNGRKLLQPAVLFSLVWFSVLLFHFICKFTLLPGLFCIRPGTYLLFLGGTVCFSTGSQLTSLLYRPSKKNSADENSAISYSNRLNAGLRIFLLTIIIIGLPFYIMAAYKLFIASNLDNFFVGLRTELTYGEEDIGPVKYLISLTFVVFGVNCYSFLSDNNTVNRIIFYITLLVSLTYGIFATGRTYFVIFISLYLGIAFVLKKKIAIKKIILLFAVFLLFFMAIGTIYGKGGDVDSSFGENLKESSQFTASYFVASLSALDIQLDDFVETNGNGKFTFRFFILLGKQFGLNNELKSTDLVQDFVFVPYSTNVYTFYRPYLKDYGVLYALFFLFFLGAFHTFVYLKALLTETISNKLYFAYLIYPVLMSFFDDQLMSLFSTWVQIFFIIQIVLFLNNLFNKHNFFSSRKSDLLENN